MQYTECKIDRTQLARKVAMVQLSAAKRTGNKNNAVSIALQAFLKRFEMHGRSRYTDYGPYWFAVKDVMRRNGVDGIGDYTDHEIAAEYCGSSDLETLAMADLFRDSNLASRPVGTRQFTLDGYTGELWTLADQDFDLPGH